jgi:hypothetical protein
VKLRIVVLLVCGLAGVGASFAFADGGKSHGEGGWCKHAVVFGTVGAPQSFAVTVSKAGRHSNLQAGQTVTVSLGSTGQTVRFVGEGCVGADGSLTVKEAELHVFSKRGDGDHNGTTTATTTTSSDATSTTTKDAGTTTTTRDVGTTTTTKDAGTTTSTTTHQ